jgi:regulator of replication initiation timing
MEEDINRLRRTIGDLRLDNASIIADNEKLKQENERLRKALEWSKPYVARIRDTIIIDQALRG